MPTAPIPPALEETIKTKKAVEEIMRIPDRILMNRNFGKTKKAGSRFNGKITPMFKQQRVKEAAHALSYELNEYNTINGSDLGIEAEAMQEL